MKLATYKDGSRDGQLVVVSRDLSTAHYATGIAAGLQQVLEDWNFLSPQLQDLYDALNHGKARHTFPFESARCLAPLPRAYQWAGGDAYAGHVELLAGERALALPAGAQADPPMHRYASDEFLGPCEAAAFADEALGIDFGAALAVITGDVAMGSSADQALEGVRLLMLVNSWSLRALEAAELNRGAGRLQAWPATSFGPVAITPDEAADAWSGGRLDVKIQCQWNGRTLGLCETGAEMSFHFGQLIAQLCCIRNVRAGSIIGSGTIGNRPVEQGGRSEWVRGYGCIAQKRAVEALQDGQPSTAYMKFGDTARIEAKARDGQSLFGAIEQKVVRAG